VRADNLLLDYLVEGVRFQSTLGLDLPKGFHYLHGQDYVLDRGTPFRSGPLTEDEHKVVLRAVDACPLKRFRYGSCFHNAQMLAAFDPFQALVYYEGYAIGDTNDTPVLHGWVSINHKVVDLTWAVPTVSRRGRLRNKVLGTIPKGWSYYGAPFPTAALIARICRIEATGSFLEDDVYGFPLFQEPRLRSVTAVLSTLRRR
jgi:hypothetical protein